MEISVVDDGVTH